MNTDRELMNRPHQTGWHILTTGIDLQQGRSAASNSDVMPLDAPFFVPAGSHIRTNVDGHTVLGSSIFR